MAGATGAIVFVYFKAPDEASRQSVVLFGGAVYAMGMLWAAAQLFSVLRRISPPPDMVSGIRPRINISYQSSPQVQFLDDAALGRAQQHLDRGGTVDDACALAEPRYRSMDTAMQKIFRTAVEAALEQRRKAR
jgi:hypothetical protein